MNTCPVGSCRSQHKRKSRAVWSVLAALPVVIAVLTADAAVAAGSRAVRPGPKPTTALATGRTVVLSNGSGDGALSVQVDPYGAYGTFNTTGRSGLRYDPVGPVGVRETTFEAALWFSGAENAGQGGRGSFLSSTPLYGGPGLPETTFTEATATTATSSFLTDGIRFTLVQQVLPPGAAGSTFCQTYTLTNTRSATAEFDLIRYVDADLIFDGANNDRAGVAEGSQRLYLFDNFADLSSPTYRMAIDLSGSANLGYRIAEFHMGDNLFAEGRAVLTERLTRDSNPGFTENDAEADVDGDRLTDSSFDINLLQGSTCVLPPGGTAMLVVNTHLGMGSPDSAIKPKIEWVAAPTPVAAGETAGCTVRVSRDALGPVANAIILFNVDGATGSNRATTVVADEDGTAQFSFTPLFPGSYTVTATYDHDGSHSNGPSEPTVSASSRATLPITMDGQSKGNGKVPAPALSGKFKFSVRGIKRRAKGQLRFSVPKPLRSTLKPFLAQSTKIEAVVFRPSAEGWTTEVLGIAKIKKGGSVPFRIDALDRGKTGVLPDRFVLTLLLDVDGDGTPDPVVYGGALISNAAGARGNVVVRPPAIPGAP